MDDLKRGYRKGQAVMEYLITYGLALFVILIVLAILVAVVLPSLQAPETCQFTQPGFACNSKPHAMVSDADGKVRILFQLDNNQGKGVELIGITCMSTSPGNIRKSDVPEFEDTVSSTERMMAPGSTRSVGDETSDIKQEITCLTDDGSSSLVLPPNSAFKGSIGVVYKFTEDVPGAPSRLAVATVTGNTQAE